MTAEILRAIQEGLLYVFGPFLLWWLVLVVVVAILAMLVVIFMEIAARMANKTL